MCGIVGYIKLAGSTTASIAGKEKYSLFHQAPTDLLDVVESLGKWCNMRGGDNAGIMSFATKKWPGIPGDADGMRLRTKKVNGHFKGIVSNIGWYAKESVLNGESTFIHTRKASSGGKDLKVAHPIMQGTITLIHNGTLAGDWRSHASAGVVSDTTAIAELMDERGIQWAYENLEGPMTMVWHDSEDQSINVIRHKSRPLHWVEHKGYHFFASESWMLDAAFDANGITLENRPEMMPEDTHFRYLDGKLTKVGKYTPKPKSTSVYDTSYYYGSGYGASSRRYPTTGNVVDLNRNKSPVVVKQKKTPESDTVISTSDIKTFQPVICKPYAITRYKNNPDTVCLTCVYDPNSSISPKGDKVAVDVAIHVLPIGIAKKLLKLQVPVMVKVTGGCKVTSRSSEYTQGFLGDFRTVVPVFEYAGKSSEISLDDGIDLITEINLMHESNSLIPGMKYLLPNWEVPARLSDFLATTLKYFKLWHDTGAGGIWPFHWSVDSEQCLPMKMVGHNIPPTYELIKE